MSVEEPNEEIESVDGKAFDFKNFTYHIKSSIMMNSEEPNDVRLDHYLTAYEELQNFFVLLGTAFQFVASDVRSKIKILRTYQREENGDFRSTYFSTVSKMIRYENDSNLLYSSKYVSGSRTLLRLHRGLDFVRKFLAEVYKLDNNVKLGSPARAVYNGTLAQHHGFLVRNTARASMQFLPTRIELLNKISNNDAQQMSEVLKLFPEALQAMDLVYERIQAYYSANKLLDLP